MDERMKPDISAPGLDVVSSVNSFTSLSFDEVVTVQFNGHSYPFGVLSGTSMATPVVAGCAALLLEASPFATAAQVKDALLTTARADNFTGVIPPQGSTAWGTGKVDAYHAVVDMPGVAGVDVHHADGVVARPNPTGDLLYVQFNGRSGHTRHELLDMTGRAVTEGTAPAAGWRMDLRALPAGVYLLRIADGARTAMCRIVKQ